MLTPWKKSYDQPRQHIEKAMIFPVVMHGYESWTIKKAECQRIDAFGLWCWRRLLRVPWTVRKSNQSILREISPGCSLERLMLKLKLPTLWPPDVKSWLIWKDPDAGKDLEQKGMTEDEMVGGHHRLNGHEFQLTLGVGDREGGLACCSPRGCKESDTTEGLYWTELNTIICAETVMVWIANIYYFKSFYLAANVWGRCCSVFFDVHLTNKESESWWSHCHLTRDSAGVCRYRCINFLTSTIKLKLNKLASKWVVLDLNQFPHIFDEPVCLINSLSREQVMC